MLVILEHYFSLTINFFKIALKRANYGGFYGNSHIKENGASTRDDNFWIFFWGGGLHII